MILGQALVEVNKINQLATLHITPAIEVQYTQILKT